MIRRCVPYAAVLIAVAYMAARSPSEASNRITDVDSRAFTEAQKPETRLVKRERKRGGRRGGKRRSAGGEGEVPAP